MRIALIRGPYLRANGVLPWEFINNEFNDIEVVAFESDPPRFDTSVLDLPVRKLPWPDGKLNLFGYDYFFSKALSGLKMPSDILIGFSKISKEFDIIHTSENFNFFSFQGALWSKLRNKQFIFSAGENIPYPIKQRNWILWKIKKFVNERANAITATTLAGKKALIHEGANPDKIEIIPNVIDFKYFGKGSKDSSKLNLPHELEDTFNILFVHGLSKQKGIPFLVDAFKRLKSNISDVRLILTGKNQLDPNYYRENIGKCDEIFHINFLPNIKMQYLYNLSDVFILPSVTTLNNEEQ
jgi:glycosyltransferase involved in cell wall biosynthesis